MYGYCHGCIDNGLQILIVCRVGLQIRHNGRLNIRHDGFSILMLEQFVVGSLLYWVIDVYALSDTKVM